MEHTQRKTWSMKHPALAKAFAVMFAVMCIVMLAAGVSGIGKAKDDNAERIRYENRYAERIENYDQLCKKLENSITYEEAWAELEKRIEQHDDDASQHKTDLAMHTAEMGGYTMGANAIYEAMPQVKEARRQLEIGKAEFAAGEAEFNAFYQAYLNSKPGIEALAAKASALASGADVSAAQTKIDYIYTVLADQPTMPVDPGMPSVPETEEEAHPGDAPTVGPELDETSASPEEYEAWQNQLAAYAEWDQKNQSYLASKATWDAYRAADAAYNSYLLELQSYLDSDEYKSWMDKVGTAVNDAAGAVEGLGGQLLSVAGEAAGYFAMFGEDLGEFGADSGTPDFSTMSPDKIAGYLSQQLNGIVAGFSGIAGGLAQIGYGVSYAASEMEAARAQLQYAETELKKAEHEVQHNLEMIWYELGQLEDERAEFEENKERLDVEASQLSKEIIEADALHELENDRTSAKLLLTSVKEVNDMVEAGGEVIPSAEKHLADYKAQTELQYKGWMLSCILAITGGVVGLAGIPAVYELSRRRFWLIAPAVLCLILSAAAEGAYYAVGLGWWYVGMFTAIISLIHLAIVLPKEKKPAIIEEN